MKVESHQRFFRPCRWINQPFRRLRVLVEGALEVAEATSEAEYRCARGGAVVGREVGSGGVRHHFHIDLVQRSGVNSVI